MRLDASDLYDHLPGLRIRLVEPDYLAFAAGQIYAYRARRVSGLLLPGACSHKHQVRPGALAGRPQPHCERAIDNHRSGIFLVGLEHPVG